MAVHMRVLILILTCLFLGHVGFTASRSVFRGNKNSTGGSLRERRAERLRELEESRAEREEQLAYERAQLEEQREVERQLRENERRQRELKRRQDEEVIAEWRQYLDQLRVSNSEIRVTIEEERVQLDQWDKYCCAPLENGEKCRNVVQDGLWFCVEHQDPPRPSFEERENESRVDETQEEKIETVVPPSVLRKRKTNRVNQRKQEKKAKIALNAGTLQEESDSKVAWGWLMAIGILGVCVVVVWIYRRVPAPRTKYSRKR